MSALTEARAMLCDVTPLSRDCGRVCGAACCRSLEGERTGMLLFPGEEELLVGEPGYEMLPTERGTLLLCAGTCQREMRPLACMLFPLVPVLRDGEIRVAVNDAAKGVCPLAASGVRGLSGEFRQAVRSAGNLLAGDDACRAHLEALTREQDEWRALRASLTGESAAR